MHSATWYVVIYVVNYIIIVGFYIGNALAPMTTEAAGAAGFAIPEDAALISSVADGFIWIPWAFLVVGSAMQWIGVVIFAAVVAVAWFFYKKNAAAWKAAAGKQ